METMVERVARAIDPVAWKWLDSVEGQEPAHAAEAVTRRHQLRQARSAIEAMRGPTADMLKASEWGNFEMFLSPSEERRQEYNAMIDAALANPTTGGRE